MQSISTSFRLPPALIKRMGEFKTETGVSQTAQVVKALNAWLTEQEQFRAQLRKSLAAKGGK